MSTPPPTTTSPPLPADLLCCHCHYNLHALPPTSRCPECGTPISDSLTHHARFAGLNPRPLIPASLCLAAAALSYLPFNLFLRINPRFHSGTYTETLLNFLPLLPYALAFLGILGLAAAWPPTPRAHRRRLFCLAALSVMLLANLSTLPPYVVDASHHPTLYLSTILVMTAMFGINRILELALYCVAFFYCRSLASALRRPWLVPLAACVFAIAAVASLLELPQHLQFTLYYSEILLSPPASIHHFPAIPLLLQQSAHIAAALAQLLFWPLLALLTNRALKQPRQPASTPI